MEAVDIFRYSIRCEIILMVKARIRLIIDSFESNMFLKMSIKAVTQLIYRKTKVYRWHFFLSYISLGYYEYIFEELAL